MRNRGLTLNHSLCCIASSKTNRCGEMFRMRRLAWWDLEDFQALSTQIFAVDLRGLRQITFRSATNFSPTPVLTDVRDVLCFRGIVRLQSNLDEHDPEECKDDFDKWREQGGCPLPLFKPGEPQARAQHTRCPPYPIEFCCSVFRQPPVPWCGFTQPSRRNKKRNFCFDFCRRGCGSSFPWCCISANGAFASTGVNRKW